MTLIDALESMTTSSRGKNQSLPYLLRLTGTKAGGTRKSDMVEALHRFYSDEQNLLRYWERLSGLEKELMEEYIRSSRVLDYDEVKTIHKKHGQTFPYNSEFSWYGVVGLFAVDSPARVFFLNNAIPQQIFETLQKWVVPVEIKYQPVPEDEVSEGADQILTGGIGFEEDFLRAIRLINSSKLKTTGGGLPTKASALKLQEALLQKEPLFPGRGFEDIRTIEQTTRIYAMAQLLIAAELTKATDGRLVPGSKVNAFLTQDHIHKCKWLLQAYLDASGIHELQRIPELKVKTRRHAQLKSCRETVLRFLTKCPVNEWVPAGQLIHYVKKKERQFLSEVVGEVWTYDEYHREYSEGQCDWEEVEGRMIQVMLMEYLSVIGIVDVAINRVENEYGYEYFDVPYLRLTKLGAHVLGVYEEYTVERQASPTSSGFIIQSNFEIVISEGTSKPVHEMFFDRFAEKVADDALAIYRVDFPACIQAFNEGIHVSEIIEYMEEHIEGEIPDHVWATLQDWVKKSGKIRIRQATIVETDDSSLRMELMNCKPIRKHIVNELQFAFEIDSNAASKVKKEIEKGNYFCGMDM